MFDNSFTSQHRFYYSELNNNEEDDMLDLNMIENIDNNVGNDDDEIISHVPKFKHASKSTLVVSHDWTLNHRCLSKNSNLEVGQTFIVKMN